MKIIRYNLKNTEKIIDKTIKVLKSGGLVIFPSDTVYGTLVDATSRAAVEKLIAFKNRPPGKPISIFVPGFKSIFLQAKVDNKQESILKTIEFAKKLNLDYASFNVATPRVGTILEKRLMQKKIEQNLNNREIKNLQTLAVRQFYLRPKYLIKKLSKIKTLFELKQQIKEGLSLIN